MKSIIFRLSLPIFLLALCQEGESGLGGRMAKVQYAVEQRPKFIPQFKELSEQLEKLQLKESAKKINAVIEVIKRNKSFSNPRIGLTRNEIQERISAPLNEVAKDIQEKFNNDDNVNLKDVADIVNVLTNIASNFANFSNEDSNIHSLTEVNAKLKEIYNKTNMPKKINDLNGESSQNEKTTNNPQSQSFVENNLPSGSDSISKDEKKKESENEIDNENNKNSNINSSTNVGLKLSVNFSSQNELEKLMVNEWVEKCRDFLEKLNNIAKENKGLVNNCKIGKRKEGNFKARLEERILDSGKITEIKSLNGNSFQPFVWDIAYMICVLSKNDSKYEKNKIDELLKIKLSPSQSEPFIEFYNSIVRDYKKEEKELSIQQSLVKNDEDLKKEQEEDIDNNVQENAKEESNDEEVENNDEDVEEVVELNDNVNNEETVEHKNDEEKFEGDNSHSNSLNNQEDTKKEEKELSIQQSLVKNDEDLKVDSLISFNISIPQMGLKENLHGRGEESRVFTVSIQDPKKLNKIKEDIKLRAFKADNYGDTWKGSNDVEYTNQRALNVLGLDKKTNMKISEETRLKVQKLGLDADNAKTWELVANNIEFRILIYEQDDKDQIIDFHEYGEQFEKNGTKRILRTKDYYYQLIDNNERTVKEKDITGCKDILYSLKGDDSKVIDKYLNIDSIKAVLLSKFSNIMNVYELTQLKEENLQNSLIEVAYMLQVLSESHPIYFYEQIQNLSNMQFDVEYNNFIKFYNSVEKKFINEQKDGLVKSFSTEEIKRFNTQLEYTEGQDLACGFYALLINDKISDKYYDVRTETTSELIKVIKQQNEVGRVVRNMLAEIIVTNPVAYFYENNLRTTKALEKYKKEIGFKDYFVTGRGIKEVRYTADIIIKPDDTLEKRNAKIKRALNPDLQEAFINGILNVKGVMLDSGNGVNKVFAAIAFIRGVNLKLVHKYAQNQYALLLDFHPFDDETAYTQYIVLEGKHYSRYNKGDVIRAATSENIKEVAENWDI